MLGMYSFSFIASGKLARDAGVSGGTFLLVLQFPFFLRIKLGLLAFFFFAFIFTASVAHRVSPWLIRSGGLIRVSIEYDYTFYIRGCSQKQEIRVLGCRRKKEHLTQSRGGGHEITQRNTKERIIY
jgi:hypothetical protein